MSDLDQNFHAAAAQSKELDERPDNDTLLQLYALYKQGSEGDVRGDRPGFLDFVGQAKYDAWGERKGMDQDTAKQRYIKLVDDLQSGN